MQIPEDKDNTTLTTPQPSPGPVWPVCILGSAQGIHQSPHDE